MSTKALSLLIVLLFLLNVFLIFQAVKYRNVIVKRNKCYEDLPEFPKFKNVNYEINLLKKNINQFDNPVIFIGSSIIDRWDFERFFKNRPYLNRGIGDNTSSDIVKRFNEDVIKLKPSRAVIYLGANDIKFNIDTGLSRKNLVKMLVLSSEHKINPLVLLPLPVVYKKNPALKYSRPERKIKKLTAELIKICIEHNMYYIDLYDLLHKRADLPDLYLQDGMHLSIKGYELLSRLVVEKLEESSI